MVALIQIPVTRIQARRFMCLYSIWTGRKPIKRKLEISPESGFSVEKRRRAVRPSE